MPLTSEKGLLTYALLTAQPTAGSYNTTTTYTFEEQDGPTKGNFVCRNGNTSPILVDGMRSTPFLHIRKQDH